jgi:hypothetical protein
VENETGVERDHIMRHLARKLLDAEKTSKFWLEHGLLTDQAASSDRGALGRTVTDTQRTNRNPY